MISFWEPNNSYHKAPDTRLLKTETGLHHQKVLWTTLSACCELHRFSHTIYMWCFWNMLNGDFQHDFDLHLFWQLNLNGNMGGDTSMAQDAYKSWTLGLILGFRGFQSSFNFGYSCFFLDFETSYVALWTWFLIYGYWYFMIIVCSSSRKIPFASYIITHFIWYSVLFHTCIYSPRVWGDLGTIFLWKQKGLITLITGSKNSSALWFYAHFFMILYMYIALRLGRQPIRLKILMSTGRPHHFGHLLQVSKKSLQPLTLYTSFHDLINVYSRRSMADNLQGTKFWCQQQPLVTSVICYKFKQV